MGIPDISSGRFTLPDAVKPPQPQFQRFFPLIFTAKDVIFDPLRFYIDLKKKALTSVLGQYNQQHPWQTFIHGVYEGVFICGVPFFGQLLILILGLGLAAFGIYRGIASIRYTYKRMAAS